MDNERLLFPEKTSRLGALAILLFFSSFCVASLPQEAPINSEERSIIETMLQDVESDIKGSYYDPKFHGVDLDSRFKQAAEHIKTATTYNQAIASVAWALRALNDSHTFLIPPRRTYKFIYGYQYMMVGDGCYISAVEPGTDADKMGLKVGDRILALNKVTPNPENLWEVGYLFRTLRPQAVDELALRAPDGTERTLRVPPKVTQEASRLGVGIDYWDLVRESQSYRNLLHRRSYSVGESVIIWKFPTFSVDEKAADDMLGQSSKYSAMILDLRGNGGGSGNTLLHLIADTVNHDVTVGTSISRKPVPPLVSKTRGDKAYHGKLVVLVDNRSASASELFARTMQLQGRAAIIGDATSGSVMEARYHFHSLGLGSWQGYGVMISEADVVMPDGKSLEHTGVVPDEKVLPTASDLANNRDPVLSHAVHLVGAELSPEDAGKLFPIEWPKN
jgi:C-terminal processing protease CtpA/Prc